MTQKVKNLPAMQDTQVQSLDQEDPLEKGMATHSSILAWRISWTEEPGGLQSMASQTIGHDWTTNTFFLFTVVFIMPLSPQTSYIEQKLHLQMWWQKDCIKKCKNLPSARLLPRIQVMLKKQWMNEWMNEWTLFAWHMKCTPEKPETRLLGFCSSCNSITFWRELATSHSLA